MSNCHHCGELLKKSQYRNNKTYKSCPHCSTLDGEEHIYYKYPESFGTTILRVTPNVPDGAQSYCTRCRGVENGPYADGIKCSDL